MELEEAELIWNLCRLFPAYTPEEALDAPQWVVRMVSILMDGGILKAST